MTNIPDDIMKVAAELDYMRSGPTSCDIALAILAERRRCWEIAISYSYNPQFKGADGHEAHVKTSIEIADAIQRGK